VGLRVEAGFVVGYGIDYTEQYRGLRDIRALPETERKARHRWRSSWLRTIAH